VVPPFTGLAGSGLREGGRIRRNATGRGGPSRGTRRAV